MDRWLPFYKHNTNKITPYLNTLWSVIQQKFLNCFMAMSKVIKIVVTSQYITLLCQQRKIIVYAVHHERNAPELLQKLTYRSDAELPNTFWLVSIYAVENFEAQFYGWSEKAQFCRSLSSIWDVLPNWLAGKENWRIQGGRGTARPSPPYAGKTTPVREHPRTKEYRKTETQLLNSCLLPYHPQIEIMDAWKEMLLKKVL